MSVSCWCGNAQLEPFGPEFFRCLQCQTIVSSRRGADADVSSVGKDESGLYGKDYWFGHQTADIGLPDIVTRVRADLPERCVHWLRTLLAYQPPPARVQELGSAHGGFVALLQQAGYDAAGLELSPFIVEFAQKTFDVPMRLGTIESQEIEPGSLNAILMMDVIEHLPDPVSTVRHIASLLSADGVLIAQTPEYRAGISYDDLTARQDPFLLHMRGKSAEHLQLFSRPSVQRLLAEAGLPQVTFEPAIFGQYDMYFVASKGPVLAKEKHVREAALVATPGGRLTQALLDATADRDLYLTEANKRLEVINSLAAEVDRLKK
jgi:2-polyprenyl-3-methyl-5-hydroxy-6-metoxy-1,4-benzoquinol methylase